MCLSFNHLQPTGHVMHQQFNIQQLYALPTVFMCFVFIWEQTATCATYSINWLVYYNRDETCLLRDMNWALKGLIPASCSRQQCTFFFPGYPFSGACNRCGQHLHPCAHPPARGSKERRNPRGTRGSHPGSCWTQHAADLRVWGCLFSYWLVPNVKGLRAPIHYSFCGASSRTRGESFFHQLQFW